MVRLTLILVVAGTISACGHAELKAPCDAGEGALPSNTLSYAEPPASDCGPMRPVNIPAPLDGSKTSAKPTGRQAR